MAATRALVIALVLLLAPEARAQTMASVSEIVFAPSLTESNADGTPVMLEVTVHRREGAGRFPLLVFNHGSTGGPVNWPLASRRLSNASMWQFFVARGFAVAEPMRRGRGHSQGEYAEGVVDGRYACDVAITAQGFARALEDVESAVQYLRAQPWADRDRVLMGGQSRGGILAVAYVARYPGRAIGAINFVGGWNGERCAVTNGFNTATFAAAGAATRTPSLWLYGEEDAFYSIAHSRANFAAFRDAGGRGELHVFPPPAPARGHEILTRPALWTSAMDAFLAQLGLGPMTGAPSP
jgi:pimeloyl-ACP methyl ester carboxylesterase